MIKRRRLIRVLGKACYAASLMVAGAGLLAIYLAHSNPLFDHPLRDLRSSLLLGFYLLYALGAALRPKARPVPMAETSTRSSGVGVVVTTGLAGAGYFLAKADTASDYLAAGAVLVATLVMAVLVWRFATRHAGEIGEARFVTTGR